MPKTATPHAEALSVGEFTRRLKNIVEGAFPAVWVRGEISNLRRQPSGHVYFTLKDAQSQLAAVLFRGDALRVQVPLRDGMQVLGFGAVSVYEPRGNYQLLVRLLEEDGVGRLQQDFERLKHKLAAEGLFDSALKRPLPAMPETIGVITSPGGAAVRDFIRILERREWRGRLIVLPVRVQGTEAAAEIAAMLRHASASGIFDLLVLTRGGGSLEDLWPFNEEVVARAIRDTATPVISAVGHEIDFTLSDFAADLRAETPSAAAELISSRRLACIERLNRAAVSFSHLVSQLKTERHRRAELLATRLARHTPERIAEHLALRLDDTAARLRAATPTQFSSRRETLANLRARLARHAPEEQTRLLRVRLDTLSTRLEQALRHRSATTGRRIESLATRLRSVGVDSTLRRGFALVRDDTGAVVNSASKVVSGKKLRLRFSDGEAGAVGE